MRRFTAILALCLAIAPGITGAAHASSEPEQLVERAKVTFEELMADESLGNLQEQFKQARAVLIVPQYLKGGFIVGGAAGNGVLLARDGTGGWSYPAFFNMAAGSVGLQAGIQDMQIILLIMNDGALQAILKNRFQLGADASVAVGSIGAGVGGSTTTNLNADVITYGKGRGVFGGGAIEGAVMTGRGDWNEEYYGQPLPAEAIVVGQQGRNPHANALRAALENRS